MRTVALTIAVALSLMSVAEAQVQPRETFGAFVNSLPQASTLNPTDRLYVLQGNTSRAIPGSFFGAGFGFTGGTTLGNFACVGTGVPATLVDCGLSSTGANTWTGVQNFNGGATSLTRPLGDNTGNVATTAFVTSAIGAINLGGSVSLKTSNYVISTNDCGNVIQLGSGSSGLFSLTIPAVIGFPPTCAVTFTNGDTGRGKTLPGDPGCSDRAVLWPLQSCTIKIESGAWAVIRSPGRWKPPANTTLNFFTDFTNGSDTAGATDGLGTGTQAFKTAETCFLNAADQIDYNAASQTQVRCNMAAATTDTQGMHSPVHAMVGAQGGAAFQIVGASLSISGAVSGLAGACRITVPSTATYSLNQVVSVYGVGGATGCNGTWQVTVTDGTHLTLQQTTFGGSYTSGGTVTNGSSFSVSGTAVGCFFGTVMQFSNMLFQSTVNTLMPDWGCKVYLLPGNVFGGSPSGAHILLIDQAQIHLTGDVGVATSAGNAFLQVQSGGLFKVDNAVSVNFLPGVNPSFSGLAFVYADTLAAANFNSVTINLNSNTVTGVRCSASLLGLVVSGSGTANTYFPGNSNCTSSTGGVVN